LGTVVAAQTKRWESPKDMTQVGLHRTQLTELLAVLGSADLPDLGAQVKEAQARLESEVKALEVRRQDEAYLPRIQSISLTSDLATLRATRAELRGFAISSPEITKARDAAVAKLEAAIRELEQFAQELPARCDQVTSRLAVDKLRNLRSFSWAALRFVLCFFAVMCLLVVGLLAHTIFQETRRFV